MRCLLHRWSKWGEVQLGNKMYAGERVGHLLYQERTCTRCGRAQVREVFR